MKIRLIAFLFLFSFSWSLFSQELAGNYFDVFSKENLQEGTQNTSSDALIDQQGILWLASYSGLVRWDGQQKRLYNENATDGYYAGGTLFRKIYEIDSTTLIAQSQGSLPVLTLLKNNEPKGKVIPFISAKNKNLKGYFSGIFKTANGDFFASWNNGNQIEIFKLENDEFQSYHIFQFNFSVEKKHTSIAFFQDNFWIGIDKKGIWKCNKQQSEFVFDFNRIEQSSTVQTLNLIYSSQQEELWLLMNTKENLYKWNSSINQFQPQTNPFQNKIDLIEEDDNGNLLFISGKYPYSLTEMYLYNKNGWTNYSQFIQPRSVSFHPTKDFKQSLLSITNNNVKIIEVKNHKVKHFLKEDLPPNNIYGNIIKGINEDVDGNIYFLEEIDGFYKMDTQTGEIISIPLFDELGNPLTYKCGGAIHRDKMGNLWFKTCNKRPEGRLVKFNPVNQQVEYFYNPQTIRDIDIGDDGKIWVTSHNFNDKKGRLSYFDKIQNKFVFLDLVDENEKNFFPEPRFLWYENPTSIWIGTLQGLVQVNPESKEFKVFTKENSSLHNDRIIVIHQNQEGKLLLGSHGGGIQIFDPTTGINKTFEKTDGLIDNHVCGIIPIDDKRYWLSTFDGLSYWDTEISLFTNFDRSHGFEEMEFNRYAFFKSSNEDIFLGNINGVNQFKTEQLIGKGQAPRIGISQIATYYGNTDNLTVEDFDLENLNKITLSPDVTYLELSFFSYDFMGGKTSKIMTKLEGYDDDWVLLGDEGKVRYKLLPPGTYDLMVKGFSTQRVPSVNNIQLKIISKPHFYKTWWFYPSLFLGLLGIGFWFFRNRIQQVKKEEAEKQEIEKRFATLELQALQAQLNPHFIFNALGAIQYYIQVKEVESADMYLTRFAKLMRKYLDSSKEKMISLKDEIELLEIYAELEQLRFDNIFDVEFIVSDELIVDDISLPVMMIQPFLENSVNHGLSSRNDGNGKMEIHFYQKNNALICEVRDNGIGRENAKTNKRKGHKSRGMTILDEKIQTMKMSGMMDINIEISDWKNDNAYPGTLVALTFSNLLEYPPNHSS